MKVKVSIRVDGDSSIGLGHLVRCSALANILKVKFDITFYCKSIPPELVKSFTKSLYDVCLIERESEFLETLNSQSITITDGYHFDSSFQQQIKKTGSKLVCIDDTHQGIFYADLIINHTPGIYIGNYQAQPYTSFCLGLKYALLRPVFLNSHQRYSDRQQTYLVCIGGADPKKMSLKILRELLKHEKIKRINVVIGASNPLFQEIEAMASKFEQIWYYRNLNEQEMFDTMSSCDVAIVPASGVLFEALKCACVPLTFWYEENQMALHDFVLENDLGFSFGDNRKYFRKSLFNARVNEVLRPTEKMNQFGEEIGSSTATLPSIIKNLFSIN